MSTLESDCDRNFSESLFERYSFVHDHKSCKGNSSSLDYLIPDAKWWLNHRSGLKTGLDDQLIDEYFARPKSVDSICSDVLSEILLPGVGSCDSGLSERPVKLCSEPDSHWVGLDQIGPWWHALDKDDLTSSNNNGSMGVEKVLDSYEVGLGQLEELMKDEERRMAYVPDGKRGVVDSTPPESYGNFSSLDTCQASEPNSPGGDLNRAQLLEALCHSQTRAREAEKSAQDACDEKDKIVNLFFQQASCLFAYRQWLRLLQLESLCLHLGRRPNRLMGPVYLPRVHSKGTSLRKNGSRAPRTKRDATRSCRSKQAIAFAVGVGLASAGLLVGWTIGWLLGAL